MTDDNTQSTEGGIRLAFYGDDFTGSTDSLEGLANNGVRAVLFMEPPTPDDLDDFDDIDAIGVAGATRTMSPSELETSLRPAFEALAEFDVPIIHYKVCSTFDSSPRVGSIGKAIDIGQGVFESSIVPVSQGTEVPSGRYVAFSNLFAEEGGELYRIDRHPTMKDHPVTPMRESDLRRHLGEQTDRTSTRISLRNLRTKPDAKTAVQALDAEGEIVVFDAVSVDQLEIIGGLLWNHAVAESGPLFVVGSSGFEHHALVHAWSEHGLIDRDEQLYRKRDAVDRLLVMSGSASPTTADQIDWAINNGFYDIRLDTEALIDSETAPETRTKAVNEAVDAIEGGQSVILYAARGPDDPAIERTRQAFDSLGVDGSLEKRLGQEQGLILRDILARTDVRRACVAGGDTSSHSIPKLSIRALEAIAPVGPGAPLCRVHSDEPAFDNLEIALKGGQIATRNDEADYFGAVRTGGISQG